MIILKTDEEIEKIAKGGKILKRVLAEVTQMVAPGVSTRQIDKEAERLIYLYDGAPGFKRVPNYQWATCIPINEQVVHTPPSSRVVKEGDVVTIDCGVFYGGFHTDAATTIYVSQDKDEAIGRFLEVGEKTLNEAISQVKIGNRIGHISEIIDRNITESGYKVISELTGHGVGRELHEDPLIPGIRAVDIEKTASLKPGMVLAIEVIYSQKTAKIIYEKGNDWSIATADGSLSACFEKTVAITNKKTLILT